MTKWVILSQLYFLPFIIIMKVLWPLHTSSKPFTILISFCIISALICYLAINEWGWVGYEELGRLRRVLSTEAEGCGGYCLILLIIHSKYFPRFWLAISTRLIHHNQSLVTKFGRILCLAWKWCQKCSVHAG